MLCANLEILIGLRTARMTIPDFVIITAVSNGHGAPGIVAWQGQGARFCFGAAKRGTRIVAYQSQLVEVAQPPV